jgi:oligopeptide/dipeptide ABC transporter ATP-binding protein
VELHGRNGNGVSSTPTTGTVLDARNLTVTFPGPNGPMKVVDGVSLSVRRGETVGIVGESGSGKTMTAMAIARLVSFPGVVSGSVVFNGKALEAMRNAQLNRLLGSSLAVIFQDPTASLNPVLKLGIQLTEGVERHRGLKRAAARALAVSRLGEVAIPMPARQLKRYPHELSGGMRQRTTIAMGLMNEPALILADEPTTALDVTVQAQIMDLLYQVKQSHDVALILISHNIALVSQNCDRILVMYAGRIVEAANTEDILQRPLHPYTRGLLASVPDIARERSIPLEEIAGQAPNMAALPTGCPYRTRCPLAVSKCARERPPLVSHEDGRREVACWVASEDIG